jgi:hypothetical protein
MKAKPEYVAPEAWQRIEGAMKRVIAVPHSEIQKRVEAERAKSSANPHKRGPKRKRA